MNRIPVNRRLLLKGMAIAPFALAGCGSYPAETPVSEDEVAALRQASQSPGPAVAKLAALPPHPWRPIFELPFATNEVPGFSAATHRVHYEHHYMEYLFRWLDGDRQLAELAMSIAGSDVDDMIISRACDIMEKTRLAANQVLLHEMYWGNFWNGSPSESRSVRRLRRQLRSVRRSVRDTWVVTMGGEDLYVVKDDDSVPFGSAALAGVDCALHAWALDFDSFADYAWQILENMSASSFKTLHASSHHWSRDLSDLPAHGRPAAMYADRSQFDRFFDEIAKSRQYPDPDRLLDGLRGLARKAGFVGIVERMGTRDRTLVIIRDPLPSGLWNHHLVSAMPGR